MCEYSNRHPWGTGVAVLLFPQLRMIAARSATEVCRERSAVYLTG